MHSPSFLPPPCPSLPTSVPPYLPPSLQAQRPDELTITADEELEVLEWDDGDGWSKGRNQSRQEGYFPQNYVRAVSPTSSPPSTSLQQLMNSHLSSTGALQQLATQVWNKVIARLSCNCYVYICELPSTPLMSE